MTLVWALLGHHGKSYCLIIPLLLVTNHCLASYYTRELIEVNAKNAYATGGDFTINENTLKKLFETLNERCLVHIINSRGLDLPLASLEQTVVLSRYASIFVKYFSRVNKTGQSYYERRTRIFPIEKFKNLTIHDLNHCAVDANDMDNLECVEDFPAVDHTSKLKPWTCERHYHLFPPDYVTGSVSHRWVPTTNVFELNIPVAIKRPFWIKSFRIEQEGITVREKVQFYIIQRERFDILLVPFSQFSNIERWSTRVTRITDIFGLNSITTTANHELLVLPTFLNPAREQTVRKMFILCRYCKPCQPLYLSFLGNIGDTTYFKIRMVIDMLNQDLSKAVTRVHGVGKWVDVFLEMKGKLPQAAKSHRGFHNEVHQRAQDVGSMPYFFGMEMLERLIRNMTVISPLQACNFMRQLSSPGNQCDCKSMLTSVFHPMMYIAPAGKNVYAEIYMHQSNLEFVSCGVPDKNSLSFVSLLWIFRAHVWLTIISSFILLSLITFILHQFVFSAQEWQNFDTKSLVKNINRHRRHFWHQYLIPVAFTYLRGLFEQGGPLNLHLWKDSRSQRLYCLSLLMFMSLSTLYKNDNITELTLPRKPLPFDSFEMLMKHKFDVFTRPIFTVTGQSHNQNYIKSFGLTGHLAALFVLGSKKENDHVLAVNTVSELKYFAGMETKYHDFPEAVSEIKSRSSYVDEELPYETRVQMNHTRVISNWTDYMMSKSGIEAHLNVVRRCNRTALLLPDVLALQLYHNMTGEGIANVFKSKTPLYTHRHGVRMLHWVPPKILEISGLLKQSGVLEWTREFFVNYMVRIQFNRNKKDVPLASNLDGQIVVVLLIVPIGVIVAIVMFFVELLKISCKVDYIVRRINWMKLITFMNSVIASLKFDN